MNEPLTDIVVPTTRELFLPYRFPSLGALCDPALIYHLQVAQGRQEVNRYGGSGRAEQATSAQCPNLRPHLTSPKVLHLAQSALRCILTYSSVTVGRQCQNFYYWHPIANDASGRSLCPNWKRNSGKCASCAVAPHRPIDSKSSIDVLHWRLRWTCIVHNDALRVCVWLWAFICRSPVHTTPQNNQIEQSLNLSAYGLYGRHTRNIRRPLSTPRGTVRQCQFAHIAPPVATYWCHREGIQSWRADSVLRIHYTESPSLVSMIVSLIATGRSALSRHLLPICITMWPRPKTLHLSAHDLAIRAHVVDGQWTCKLIITVAMATSSLDTNSCWWDEYCLLWVGLSWSTKARYNRNSVSLPLIMPLLSFSSIRIGNLIVYCCSQISL